MNQFPWAAVLAGVLIVGWTVPGAGQEKVAAPDARLATKVTLTVEGATLGELLRRLGKDYDVTFVVAGGTAADQSRLLARRLAKVSVKDVPLSKVLADVLKQAGAIYKTKPDYIEVSPAQS